MEAQRRFHRYVAVLFALTFPALAILEISSADMQSSLAPIRWASYVVLAIWAIWLTQRADADAMVLVLSTTWFFGTLAIIEALFDVDISAFDFATTFGLIMLLGVLAGDLAAMDEQIETVDGAEPGREPECHDGQRRETQGLRQHLEGDSSDHDPGRETKRERRHER